jgi:hypothetical protein
MNILTEIIETVDYMMEHFEKDGFYEQFIHCDRFKLRREFEIQMQRNWEQLENMQLSEEQMLEIISRVTSEAMDDAFNKMIMSGELTFDSVDSNGELLYRLNNKL